MLRLALPLALTITAAPAFAQSTAAFPDPGAPRPVVAPVAPVTTAGFSSTAPVYSNSNGHHAGFIAPASFSQPAPPPPVHDEGYAVEERASSSTLVLGGVLLAVPYATGLGIAAASDFANASGWLALPVAGPWAALAAREDPCDQADDATEFNSSVQRCVAEPLVRGLLVFDGVLQAAGTIVMIAGAGMTEKRVVNKPEKPKIWAAPALGSAYGMSLGGSF
jgi:hypothetical protein